MSTNTVISNQENIKNKKKLPLEKKQTHKQTNIHTYRKTNAMYSLPP